MEYGTIGYAVKELQDGNFVAREGWNGKGMYLFLRPGGGASKVMDKHGNVRDNAEEQDVIYMKTAQSTIVPWLCSQSDLLATDWVVIP